MDEDELALNRRRFLECFAAAGPTLMPGALMAVAQDARQVTPEMLSAAARIAGVSFTTDEQQAILARLNGPAGPLPGFDALRNADLGDTQPAFVFHPCSPARTSLESGGPWRSSRSPSPGRRPTRTWPSFR
jgi:hypothetical protein